MDREEKKNSGFSVIEMIIVMGIVLILSAMFIGYNRTSGKNFLLYTEQMKVMGVLNEAKSLALQKFKQTSADENIRVCAYGVAFTGAGTYSIFSVSKDVRTSVPCPTSNAGSRQTVRSYELNNGVQFATTPSGGWIAFVAPYLETENSGAADDIILQLSGTSYTKTIQVEQGGAVSAKRN